MSLRATLSSLLSVTGKKGEVLVCTMWQSENSLYYGDQSEEILAVREVKCGAHQKHIGSESPNGTTDAPENH